MPDIIETVKTHMSSQHLSIGKLAKQCGLDGGLLCSWLGRKRGGSTRTRSLNNRQLDNVARALGKEWHLRKPSE